MCYIPPSPRFTRAVARTVHPLPVAAEGRIWTRRPAVLVARVIRRRWGA